MDTGLVLVLEGRAYRVGTTAYGAVRGSRDGGGDGALAVLLTDDDGEVYTRLSAYVGESKTLGHDRFYLKSWGESEGAAAAALAQGLAMPVPGIPAADVGYRARAVACRLATPEEAAAHPWGQPRDAAGTPTSPGGDEPPPAGDGPRDGAGD